MYRVPPHRSLRACGGFLFPVGLATQAFQDEVVGRAADPLRHRRHRLLHNLRTRAPSSEGENPYLMPDISKTTAYPTADRPQGNKEAHAPPTPQRINASTQQRTKNASEEHEPPEAPIIAGNRFPHTSVNAFEHVVLCFQRMFEFPVAVLRPEEVGFELGRCKVNAFL